MRTRPRLYWYMVCAYSPWLSVQRLFWMHQELSAAQLRVTSGVEARLLERIRNRFMRLTERHGACFYTTTKIGKNLVLPHGLSGIFIAGFAEIGDNCTIFQMVTIGSKTSGHPKIGNGVMIGAGATIIGNTVIGDGAKIGAGVTLVDARIEPGEVVINKSAYSLTRKAFIYPQD